MKDDTISRQAALDALNGLIEIYLNNLPPTVYKEDAIKAVKALPSAQPDVPDTNVGDMISRQAAMDDDRLKQCKCCDNFINAIYFDEEPWCRVKPYHQMPKTKPGDTRCEFFTSPVFICKWDEGR